MAAVVILAVIGTIVSSTMLTATDGYITAANQAQLHSELSVTLDRIERELRRIPIKASYASIAPNITSVTASSIAWTNGGTYALSRSGNQLMFVENGAAAAILLDNVTGFAVQTYDESNTALGTSLSGTACDPIRRISIQITMQRSGVTETLRTKVFVRGTVEGASSS